VIESRTNSGGPGVPMNRAIAAAESEWIITLDHDDELLPDRVKHLKENIHEFSHAGAVIGRMLVREHSRDRGHLLDTAWGRVLSLKPDPLIDAKTAYAALARWGCYAMSCSAMAFPKRVWSEVGGFDESLRTCIDFAFLEASLRSYPLGVLNDPVAYWTWSERNLSHDAPRRVFEVSTVLSRMDVPEEASILRPAMLDRVYYLCVRGEYRAAWALWKRAAARYGIRSHSLTVPFKCLAKVAHRQFAR
jgi:glycosyltransferase involved in cell wall biosynthesis